MTDLCYQTWLVTAFSEVCATVSILQMDKLTPRAVSSLTRADPGMTRAGPPALLYTSEKTGPALEGGLCQIKRD